MQHLQKYIFHSTSPLSQPYNKDGLFNAYYKAYQQSTNKQLLISQFHEPKYEKLLSKQKRLLKLKSIKHHNLSQIYDVILDQNEKKLFIILQWCSGGNLYDYQKYNSSLDCHLAVKILHDTMQGLKYLHQCDQMHRYINMQNIEFDSKGTPKLTYKCLYPKTYYLSPEDKQRNRSKQSDIFSLGVVFYKLLLGQTPFKGNSLNQQLQYVLDGPKFPKDDHQMFPLSLPISIKNLIIGMTMYKPSQRLTDDFVIQNCHKFLQISSNPFGSLPTQLPQEFLNKIFKNQYIPIYTRKKTHQQSIIITLNPQKFQLIKFHIYKSKQKQALLNYIKTILQPFKNRKNQIDLVPIYQYSLINQQYLVIKTFYDNQGSLQYYFEHSGKIYDQHKKIFIQQLTQKLQQYSKSHNYLTADNILIRGGDFYINYPPFLTNQLKNQLKNSKKQITFIAPQIKQGKNSPNADTWSLAALKYFIQNEQYPKFDKTNKLLLPNKTNKADQNFYQNYLVYNPKQRKQLINKQKFHQPLTDQNQHQLSNIQQTYKTNQSSSKINNNSYQKKIGQFLFSKFQIFQHLEKHWTKPIRVGIKCIIGVIMLLFLFYFNFFIISGQLITQSSLYQPCQVYIRAFPSDSTPYINYTLVTKQPNYAQTLFYNQTVSVIRDKYFCVLNDYSVGSNVVQVINQPRFTAYQVFGILFSIFNLIIFCISLSKMDFPKTYFISNIDTNNFNQIWNWMFINIALASQISCIYLIYGSLFHLSLEPCLTKATLKAVQYLFKKWYFSFNIRFIWIYFGLIFSYMVIIFLLIKPKFIIHKYIKIFLILLYTTGVFIRIMGGSGDYIAWQKQSVFGKLGELLLLIISVIFIVIDLIFACKINGDKVSGNGNQVSQNQPEEVSKTQENFIPS